MPAWHRRKGNLCAGSGRDGTLRTDHRSQLCGRWTEPQDPAMGRLGRGRSPGHRRAAMTPKASHGLDSLIRSTVHAAVPRVPGRLSQMGYFWPQHPIKHPAFRGCYCISPLSVSEPAATFGLAGLVPATRSRPWAICLVGRLALWICLVVFSLVRFGGRFPER